MDQLPFLPATHLVFGFLLLWKRTHRRALDSHIGFCVFVCTCMWCSHRMYLTFTSICNRFQFILYISLYICVCIYICTQFKSKNPSLHQRCVENTNQVCFTPLPAGISYMCSSKHWHCKGKHQEGFKAFTETGYLVKVGRTTEI